ncbi:Regulation of nuclear pre-mRNA domain-containing protein 2 [Takifugu flavidus]|uniref:Regulation of nuclear pre-mRNA domain-containing protein 2 n=1 Tax=Takifugu flavidus TaxID=433684 RepID=A0A5C6NFI7_9TELE|nr:Regulation of nuclear pre-mRNA domain-containing protein 2 [Takifugu flavidus]
MAEGAGAISGDSLESSLEKRFQNVTNTMDSIQGLSTWCVDNKKYHSLIVRHWIKCLKKSVSSHRLNLFYVANDVIQNCKRKNAIVYRTAFAEVLRDACMLVNLDGDRKVIKSVGRILSIWEERGVYSGSLITELKSTLTKAESPPETPVEQKTPVESKADLRSTIVAEFVGRRPVWRPVGERWADVGVVVAMFVVNTKQVQQAFYCSTSQPQTLVDKLSRYKKSVEEVDLREKQLAAMRIDICNAENLKKLKDKAGGKKFSKDFEEGSAQLQEFIKLLNGHCKTGPPLMQILGNADIFYETQYKEVKIVANAYQAFANRVSHLKRKLDALKATLPDLDDSPIPSPSADAPSPTGSESPFHDMDLGHPDLDVSAMDEEAEPPAPSPLSSPGGSPKHAAAFDNDDNRMVEDMDLSEEEADGGVIAASTRTLSPISLSALYSTLEQQIECPPKPEASAPFPATTEPSVAAERPVGPFAAPVSDAAAAVDGIDLAKIGSILNNVAAESPPVTVPAESSVKAAPAASGAPQDATSLVNLLSKVDVSPVDLLSALSKVQKQSSFDGIDSLLTDPAANACIDSFAPDQAPPTPVSTSASLVPPQSQPPACATPVPSDSQAPAQTYNPASALIQALHNDMDLSAEHEPSFISQSLESKIHNFLQGNSAFNAFDLRFPGQPGENLSPVTGADAQVGTPVRDEGGGTPTQDEMMDKGAAAPAATTAYQKPSSYSRSAVGQNGQLYRHQTYANHDVSERGVTVGHYPPVSAQTGRPGEMAPGSDASAQPVEPVQMVNESGWYNNSYPEGSSQLLRGFSAPPLRGAQENKAAGLYPYQAEQSQQPKNMASQQGLNAASAFFTKSLPPVPVIPPPPRVFENPLPGTSGALIPQEPPLHAGTDEMMGDRVGSVISGMVVHDHQHKSVFHPDNSIYDNERAPPPRPEDQHYPEAPEHYHNEPHPHNDHFFQEEPYLHPDEPYHRHPGPGPPPHRYPRVRGHLTPPLSPAEDPYFSHDYQRHGPPPPPRFALRRPPPHPEMRHPGLRPPHRPPHPPPHHFPRGPPRPPFPPFRGPEPRLRGKRPGPLGRGSPGPMFAPKRPFPPPRY